MSSPGAFPNAGAVKSLLTEAARLHQSGQRIASLTPLRQAAQLAPDEPNILHRLGLTLLETGQAAAALIPLNKAIAVRPSFANAHWRLGLALESLGRAKDAMASYSAALSHDSSIFGAAYRLAWLQEAAGQHEEAAQNYRRASERQRKPDSFLSLAQALRLERRADEAKTVLRDAIAHDPKYAAAHALLGDIFAEEGQFEDAFPCFAATIDHAPDMVRGYQNLVQCRRMTAGDAALVDKMRSATRLPSTTPLDRAMAGFALGKSLDDMDRYDEAFAAYKDANQGIETINRAAGRAFNFESFRGYVDRKTTKKFTAGPSLASDLPVFIVGMPRSGTSLVEQIAASHSQIHGAGELTKIEPLAAQLARGNGSIAELADAHLNWLREIGRGASRVIDKLPDNILFLDTIAALYPNAKVIFCVREPRDVSLSCYFQMFSSGNAFSYNLADCGRREVQTARLMRHWQKTLPLATLTVTYETLVESLEAESRRIIDFLGVAWEPAVLDFHRTNRAVATSSKWQVRQPLYNRSVGRWQHYRDHLGELEAALAQS